MLKSFFPLLILLVTNVLTAQEVSNQVVNSTGGFGQIDANYSVAYAVGEPIIATFSTAPVTLTQGFLQPEIRVRTGIFIQKTDDNCAFKIFPNPTAERIFTDDLTNRTFDILTIEGQIVGSYQPKNGSIDVSQLPQGAYFIRSLCGGAKAGQFTTLTFIKQ